MNRFFIFFFIYVVAGTDVVSSQGSTQEPLATEIPSWFPEAKFGVFVHFAENGHFRYFTDTAKTTGREHNREAYVEGASYYTLNEKHVREWVKKFEEWGARYAVLTTNHRPGFALWDTDVHDRNIVDMSPAGFDVVEVWSEALNQSSVRNGYYFSHYDWGDPDFIRAKNPSSPASAEEKGTAWQRYLKKRDAMVRELVTDYGNVDLIWWDEDWCAEDYIELGSDPMLDTVFKYQPDVVINNRSRHPWRWHYATPEKFVPLKEMKHPWETCDNLTQDHGWGYKFPYGYTDYKTPDDILLTFLDVISGGGNYLLNIGPQPNGVIPEEEVEIMDYLGEFINTYPEAIYGTTAGIPRACYGDPSTSRGNSLYLFVTGDPITELTVKGIKGEVQEVVRMKTGEKVPFRLTGGRPAHGKPAWIRIAIPALEGDYPEVYKVRFQDAFDVALK